MKKYPSRILRGRVALAVYLLTTLSLPLMVMATEPLPQALKAVEPGLPFPSTVFIDQNGRPTTISAFRGKTVVINVWATWCGPCVKELPSLDRLADALNPDTAAVLIVSQDKGGYAVTKPFLDKLGIAKLKGFTDSPNKMTRDLSIRGLPTTFIVSPTGAILRRAEGPLEWDAEDIVTYVKSLQTVSHD